MKLKIKTNIEISVANLTSRSESIAVGRAAWGLFALLSIWKVPGKIQKIALPSFLCQSPLASTLLAGWVPEFCDVDIRTGNVSDAEWSRALNSGIQAVLFVHLFGNVGNAEIISQQCKEKGIFFIEDAAQAFGGKWKDHPCGSFGNASLVSFGHTKLIDGGNGGVVLTNDYLLINELRKFKDSSSFPENNERKNVIQQYLKSFYQARKKLTEDPEKARSSFKGLILFYMPLIFIEWNMEFEENILNRLKNIDFEVEKRRIKYDKFKKELSSTILKPLNYSAQSVPWRANFTIPDINWKKQDILSEVLRQEKIDISNLYVPSHWLMDNNINMDDNLTQTIQMSQEIFQLWIDDSINENKIIELANIIKDKLKYFD